MVSSARPPVCSIIGLSTRAGEEPGSSASSTFPVSGSGKGDEQEDPVSELMAGVINHLTKLTVGEVVTRTVITIGPESEAREATRLMLALRSAPPARDGARPRDRLHYRNGDGVASA